MNYQRFSEILSKFGDSKIAVVGDMFLDKWLTIDRELCEYSVETDLEAYQVVGKRMYAGAAGTVMNNLSDLGNGKVYAVGFVGDDGEGYEFLKALDEKGVDHRYVMKSKTRLTPTYTKPLHRKNGVETESNRLDFKNVGPTPADIEDYIIASLWELAPKVDAIIALDQLCDENTGAITERVRDELPKIAEKYPQLIIYADSRAFIDRFRGVIVKCNDKEAQTIINGKESEPYDLEVVKSCHTKLNKTAGRDAFVTLGPLGVLAMEAGVPVRVPTVKVEGPIDIVGAGDACSSGIVSALCAGASPAEAAFIGNLCSSITIQVIGHTGTASRPKLLKRFSEYFNEDGTAK